MKNYILLILLMLFFTEAQAQWQKIGESVAETAYVSEVEPHGADTVRMWGLFNLKTSRVFGDMQYLSMLVQREYHCKKKTSGIIYMKAFSKGMGAGEMIYSNNARSTQAAILPDSAEEALWRLACEQPRR
jgi:hypothetical protein